MYIKKNHFSLLVFLCIFLICFIFNPGEVIAAIENYPEDLPLIGNIDEKNIIKETQPPIVEVDGKYNSILYPSSNTKYEVTGNSKFPTLQLHNKLLKQGDIYEIDKMYKTDEAGNGIPVDEWTVVEKSSKNKENPTRTVLFSYSDFEKKVEQKITATNIGMYRGRSIDMEVSVAYMKFDMEARQAMKEKSIAANASRVGYLNLTEELITNTDHMGIRINLLSPDDRSNSVPLDFSGTAGQYSANARNRSVKIEDSLFAFGVATEDDPLIPLKSAGSKMPIAQMSLSNFFNSMSYFNGEEMGLDFKFYYSSSSASDEREYVENYQGMWNWANMNIAKDITIKVRSINDFYIIDGEDDLVKNVYYYTIKDTDESGLKTIRIHGMDSGEGAIAMKYRTSRLTQVLELANGIYNVKVSPMKRDNTLQPYETRRAAFLGYGKYPVPRVAPYTDVIGEKNDAVKTDEEDYHKLKYSFIETIAANSSNNRDKELVLESTLPQGYTFGEKTTDVKVEILNKVNEAGDDNMSGEDLFNISYSEEDGVQKIKLEAKNPDSEDFVGNVYKVSLVANKKDSAINAVADRYKLVDGAIADGYLRYELGKSSSASVSQTNDQTATTSVSYKAGEKIENSTQAEKIVDASEAKVRHLSTLSFSTESQWIDQNVNIAETFPDPSIFLSELKVDDTGTIYSRKDIEGFLDSKSKKIQQVEYKDENVMSSDTPGGSQEFILKVTIDENGVTRIVETTAEVYTKGAYVVKFLGNDTNNEVIDPVTLNYPVGESVDLKENEEIKKVIETLTGTEENDEYGYTKVAYYAADNDGQLETNFQFKNDEGVIIYRANTAGIDINIPSKMPFEDGTVSPGKEQTLNYSGEDDFMITVKDLRTFVAAKEGESKEENGRGQLEIQAKITEPFKGGTTGKTLTNTALVWKHGSTDGTIDNNTIPEEAGSSLSIYKNSSVDKDKTIVKVMLSSSEADSKDQLTLEVAKGNNAEAETYESTITWQFIYAP